MQPFAEARQALKTRKLVPVASVARDAKCLALCDGAWGTRAWVGAQPYVGQGSVLGSPPGHNRDSWIPGSLGRNGGFGPASAFMPPCLHASSWNRDNQIACEENGTSALTAAAEA